MDELDLREEAAQCRRLANVAVNPSVEAELLRMAAECEAEADLAYVRMLDRLSVPAQQL